MPERSLFVGAIITLVAAGLGLVACGGKSAKCLKEEDLGACFAQCGVGHEEAACVQRDRLLLKSCTTGKTEDCGKICSLKAQHEDKAEGERACTAANAVLQGLSKH